jgi:RimJ/RimL family protein N-acetyltransferase
VEQGSANSWQITGNAIVEPQRDRCREARQMINSEVQIRRLAPEDAQLYRAIRLEALRLNPEAFGSTFEVENTHPRSWFAERIGSCEVFGAFANNELVGVVGLLRNKGRKEQHKTYLWGMYVRAASRNAGIGRCLVETVLAYARSQVELIQLAVVSNNDQARRLYASLGFVEYGIERKSLKHEGQYFDEILMAKDLQAD